MHRSILIIDDEKSIQISLKGALEDEGYSVYCASSGMDGLSIVKKQPIDLVLLDVWMPDWDGITTLEKLKTYDADLLVVVMSGHGTIETAVRATKLGAYDFVEKPLSLEKLLLMLGNALRNADLRRENKALRHQQNKGQSLLGQSPLIEGLREKIRRVAPTLGSVLITGDNGTGKELAAQMIHSLSQRYGAPFVAVNCAAIPEELIESELFGHEKGAFTGATQLRRGKFDLAQSGTLFLDEIADMSLRTQAKILRVLQEQVYTRVGGQTPLQSDVRILAATNKDLRQEIVKGTFREDLFYRLNVIPIHVPPLRERVEDIDTLAQFFLEESARAYSRKFRPLSAEAAQLLKAYTWPGNVRELKNMIDRTMILTHLNREGAAIEAAEVLEHFSVDEWEPLPVNKGLREAREAFEKQFISRVLKTNEGNVSRSAVALGIERSHLHKKIKAYGLTGNVAEDRGT